MYRSRSNTVEESPTKKNDEGRQNLLYLSYGDADVLSEPALGVGVVLDTVCH
jgi:hypothetical protein